MSLMNRISRWRQSMRRRARTGRLIVECTDSVPPLPRVESTRRQPEEPQECPQRNARAGLSDGMQNPPLVGTIGQSLARQREARDAQQDQSESEQRREFLHASSEFEDFVSEFQLGQVRHVQTDRHGQRGAEPPRAVDRGTPRSVAMVRSSVR